jgi:hypothetical protein
MRKLESRVIPFSVLGLAPINQGSDAAQAFRNSLDLAQHVDAGITDGSGLPNITTCPASQAPRLRW